MSKCFPYGTKVQTYFKAKDNDRNRFTYIFISIVSLEFKTWPQDSEKKGAITNYFSNVTNIKSDTELVA